jgi:ATP adenylyltransferase
MEKMWSPWRSQYIDSFNTDKKKEGCIFCASGKENEANEDNLLVHKDKLTFTILNLYPYNNGHIMVVPYRHTNDFSSISMEEGEEIFRNLQKGVTALKELYNPEGFNMGANMGKVSGAGIEDHIHFHIVPRWNGDTNFMPVLGDVKVISQDLKITKKKLLEIYNTL